MRATAARGDDAYRVMLEAGLDRHLEAARAELTTI